MSYTPNTGRVVNISGLSGIVAGTTTTTIPNGMTAYLAFANVAGVPTPVSVGTSGFTQAGSTVTFHVTVASVTDVTFLGN
jgi:hypothetical protein